MTHSKLDIDWILEQLYAFGQQDGLGENHPSHIRTAKQALLEAFEQSLNTIIGEDEWEDPDIKGSSQSNGDQVEAPWRRNHLRQYQRNEAIKVIRGTE